MKRIVSIKFGKPLTFEDLIGQEPDKDALRDITDRIMHSIAELVGTEYRP